MSIEEKKAEKIAIAAATTAEHVALEAAMVAREVAQRASDTADKVAQLASEASQSVLLLGKDIGYIKSELIEIKEKLDNKYVTQDRYMFTEKVVWGLVVAVIGAFVTIVFRS